MQNDTKHVIIFGQYLTDKVWFIFPLGSTTESVAMKTYTYYCSREYSVHFSYLLDIVKSVADDFTLPERSHLSTLSVCLKN